MKFSAVALLAFAAVAVRAEEEEEVKQFFGGAFRPFFMRPFPLSTNHYPTADTVPTAFDARQIGNKWLRSLNVDPSERNDNIPAGRRQANLFAVRPIVRDNGEEIDVHDFEHLEEYLGMKHGKHWEYIERSFTAKSDGFILEWAAQHEDTRRMDRTRDTQLAGGVDVVTLNLRGRVISLRSYSWTHQNSIIENAVATPDLSTLVTVLTLPEYAPVFEALSGAGPFTVFAPTNAAFAAAGIDVNDNTSVNVATVTAVLKFHVIAGAAVYAGDLAATQSVATLNGAEVLITSNDQGVTVNGNSKVVIADVASSNGVVHVVDTVLLP